MAVNVFGVTGSSASVDVMADGGDVGGNGRSVVELRRSLVPSAVWMMLVCGGSSCGLSMIVPSIFFARDVHSRSRWNCRRDCRGSVTSVVVSGLFMCPRQKLHQGRCFFAEAGCAKPVDVYEFGVPSGVH